MPFANAFLIEFDTEMKATRSMLERVPFANASWKPHVKSMSLGALASHITSLAGSGAMITNQDGFDVASASADETLRRQYHSVDESLAAFDANVAASRAALAALPNSKLDDAWTLGKGRAVILSQPRSTVLRSTMMNHIIHHRGQLGVYLRLNDVPLPPIYGPTADTV